MAPKRILDRLLGPLALAAARCALNGCGPEPTGVVLEYEVDQDAMPREVLVEMDHLVAAVNSRLGKAGRARVSGDGRIEVDIFGKVGAAELDSIKRRIFALGRLEFSITANRKDHAEVIALAKANEANSLEQDGHVVAHWVVLDPGRLPKQVEHEYLITRTDGSGGTEVLVMDDSNDVTGAFVASVRSSVDEKGRPAIDLTFNSQGADRLGRLTAKYTPDHETGITRHLGIVLDGKLFSAPAIRGVVTKNVQLTGSFTMHEVETLIAILNAGSLPCQIRPVSERTVAE